MGAFYLIWLLVCVCASQVISGTEQFSYVKTNPSFTPRSLDWILYNDTAYVRVDKVIPGLGGEDFDVKDDPRLLFSFGQQESKDAVNHSALPTTVSAGGRPVVTTRVINPGDTPYVQMESENDVALFDFSIVLDSISFINASGSKVVPLQQLEWEPMRVVDERVPIGYDGAEVEAAEFILASTDGSAKIFLSAGGWTLKSRHGIVTPQSLSLAVHAMNSADVTFDRVSLSTLICSPGKKTVSHSNIFGHDPFVGIKTKYKKNGEKTKYRGYLAWSPWIHRDGRRTRDKVRAQREALLDKPGAFEIQGLSQKYSCAAVNISSPYENRGIPPETVIAWHLRVGFGPTPPLYSTRSLWVPILIVGGCIVVVAALALTYERKIRRQEDDAAEENLRKRLLGKSLDDEVLASYSSVEILGAYDGQPKLLRSCSTYSTSRSRPPRR